MGRARSFNEAEVIAVAASTFLHTGYEATSIDDLVEATGVHRGSLYKAFGSKRALFLRALDQVFARPDAAVDSYALDLALVALLELGPRDAGVRDCAGAFVATLPGAPACVLGERLLSRAGIVALPTTGKDVGAIA